MEKKGTTYGPIEVPPLKVSEPALAYLNKKQQGEYTLEDYYALPDDMRAELIDGVIYNMSSPTNIHQLFIGEMYAQLRDYIRKKGGKCILLSSPCDVQLNQDNRTMVQPDVLIVCNRDLVLRRVVYGAPDFVVEVLSPSTRKKDVWIKLQKYKAAGVREYWIVDPDKKMITVYDFEKDSLPVTYGFEDKVPVRIFGNECVIDFVDIYEQIRFLYER